MEQQKKMTAYVLICGREKREAGRSGPLGVASTIGGANVQEIGGISFPCALSNEIRKKKERRPFTFFCVGKGVLVTFFIRCLFRLEKSCQKSFLLRKR